MNKSDNCTVNEFLSSEWFAHIITYHFTMRNKYDYLISNRYPDRDIHITVSEDGENGATIYYNTTKPYQQIAI